jgi:arsenite-transporting ATPase
MDRGTPTPFFLCPNSPRLLIFGGKGGGGKTTCASATALRLSLDHPDRSFLLVSTDPAHSLVDILAGSPPPCNLQIVEFDAQQSLAAFKEKHREQLRLLTAHGTFLDEDDITRFLDLSLPGLDELMSFLEIAGWEKAGASDYIIVDTAPTGHTLRLLSMPELVGKWLSAMDAMQAKHRYMQQRFAGSSRLDEADEFLQELTEAVERMEALLRNPSRCRFIPVMVPEALSINETAALLKKLGNAGVPVTDIVVNRLYVDNCCPVCEAERYRQVRELRRVPRNVAGSRLWGVPLFPEEIRGVQALQSFWQEAAPLHIDKLMPGLKPLTPPPCLENPAPLPGRETKLILLAGKGGVGKTTLACATALRMARDFPGKKVLLFSTDPAHSLSDCLDVRIGPKPVRVDASLTAMAIDAQAEFEALKAEYKEELEEIMTAIAPNLDLSFDRVAMERIMDLSPSGVDEVMAVTRIMELLAAGTYDFFILDTAPTGHLIRFLELPGLIDQWLKALFDIFLKYRRIFRIPRITGRMVQMSKNLKRLRTVLLNPAQASLYTVAIPTEMAFEETKDLVSACIRMGINVPTLFLNLATPDGQCSLCHALHRRETVVRAKFGRQFRKQHQVLICRQPELRGILRLTEFGQALYHPAGGEQIPAQREERDHGDARPDIQRQ